MADEKRFTDDFEEYEVTEEHHPSKLGTVIRIIFYIMIVLVNGAIIFRVCMAEDPGSVDKLEINDTLRAAYKKSPDDFSVYTQSVYDMYTEDGVYYATGLFLCPSAGQLQVTVRYNVRTADDAIAGTTVSDAQTALLDGSGLLPPSPLCGYVLKRGASVNVTFSESEMRDKDFFAFRLTDNDGNYYPVTADAKSTRILYVYHRLTFDGIPDKESDLYLEIYPSYKGAPDYTTVLGRMRIYSIERRRETYDLSKSELSSLGE